MTTSETIDGAAALGLSALGWTVGEPDRAARLLAVTGLTPDDLRSRVSDPHLLAAVLGFLEAHEPDLLACGDALGAAPADLVRAREALERAAPHQNSEVTGTR